MWKDQQLVDRYFFPSAISDFGYRGCFSLSHLSMIVQIDAPQKIHKVDQDHFSDESGRNNGIGLLYKSDSLCSEQSAHPYGSLQDAHLSA